MKYRVKIGDRTFEVTIDGNQPFAHINGRRVEIDYRRLRGGRVHSLLADNINFEFELEKSNGGFELWHGARQVRAEVVDEKTERLKRLMGETAAGAKVSVLTAPMPGLVIKVEVKPGQQVKKGDGLVIVEAMKMENELKAHASGVVKEIKVEPGQKVEKNQTLVVFE